ncbi:bacillithiol system redox-active protein YtxJ [Chitinophagaceae bacterium LB-8]|uniref:Bacillithiol system redox-active protein YtxJ n=1 Tax=Paraflavisolibacter caeni TaxID=2982496 RepID=A0A9X3B981_9BACT|nr:bacillithiol system redox-active protein YtxJ [Paraflavisolibacter caeni]MCU7550791.1 bacillithiol system redox-active protein YtxJ [Paraflavisolibacter caeni]
MQWIHINNENQLGDIIQKSSQKPQVIFKHSTRCSVSSVALNRLQKAGFTEQIDFYYLDLIAHRNISNQIAEIFKIQHESPQVLLIKEGKCIYDESHLGISMDEIEEQAEAA